MTSFILPQTSLDAIAVEQILCHWLRRISESEPGGLPDCVGSAAESCLTETIRAAENAGVAFELGFCDGAEFGMRATLAVLGDALGSPVQGLESALERAKSLINVYIEDYSKTRNRENENA